MNTKAFSEFVKKRRLEKGFPRQEDLAAVINVSQDTISNYENGKKPPTVPNLILLAHALDVRPGWLLELLDEDAPEGKSIIVPDEATDGEITAALNYLRFSVAERIKRETNIGPTGVEATKLLNEMAKLNEQSKSPVPQT